MRTGLEAAGATVFDYIPDFTFIVRMDAAAVAAVQAQAGVRWVGPYLPAFRLSRDVLAAGVAATVTAGPASVDDAKRAVPLDGGAPEVVVDIFPGEPVEPVVAAIEGWGGKVSDRSQTEWRSKLKVTLTADHLTDLAQISGVRWIEAAPQWKLFNNKATDIIGARTAWNTQGLRGTGQVVAVADTGLDKGSTAPANLHDDFENGSGVSRVATIFDRVGDGASDVNSGHGTHVAGSVLGNGKKSGSNPAAHSYPSSSYAGIAPEATLVFQAVESNSSGSLSGLPLDLNDLFAQAAGAGAKIHTNSWGSGDAGAYTEDSGNVDEYAWNHKDFTILFAAGNEGIDANGDGVIDLYSLGSPASAKNAITVGASENNRPSGSSPAPGYDVPWGTGSWLRFYPTNPVRSDHVSNNPNGMAAFSSRGPALDGRIKPDIVAPGTNIISTFSSLAQPGENWGSVNSDYVYQGGTSMATPLTAGATTIVRQFYTDKKGIAPSSALLKATLANGATNMAPGQYGGGSTQEIANTRPTNVAGWGRVNLESLFPASPRVMEFADEKTGVSTGGSKTFNYSVGSSSQPFKVSLAWTDYPGSAVAGGGLVNDLDIRVVGPGGTTYYPNNANQRAPAQHLAYDDGYPASFYSWSAGKKAAVRFTPTRYPADLQLARFFVGANYASDFPKTFNWQVYNGTSSGPTSLIASGSTTIRDVAWHTVDLTSKNIRINSGDFFIALELPDSAMLWGYEGRSPLGGRSWDYSGSSWSPWPSEDYLINAVMTSPAQSTPNDRVNNLQGIDIANPPVGAYQVIVSGYNVPQGPQPYALVTSYAKAGGGPTPTPAKRFLPMVLVSKPPLPDTPVLNPIDNGDKDGNYTVSWNTAKWAGSYVLAEDDNSGFSSPTTVYDGSNLNFAVTGHAGGTWYYRVYAKNSTGNSNWSNMQSTVIQVALPTRFDAVADATILSANGGTNFGIYQDMLAGYWDCDSPAGVWRSLVKFNLSPIPAGTSISSARLSLSLIEACDWPDRVRTLSTYRAGADWSETGVTWNNQPPIQEAYGSVDIPTSYGARHSVDVTNLVRGWVNGSFPNQGMILRSIEVQDSSSGAMGFGTHELGGDYMPYLEITYTGAPPADTPTGQPGGWPACANTVFKSFGPTNSAKTLQSCAGK